MADHFQTVTNELKLWGGGLTSLWGVMEWGTDNWGENDPLLFKVGKLVSNEQSFTVAVVKFPQHIVTNSQAFSVALTKSSTRTVVNSLPVSSDCVSMVRGSGGYDYVFSGGGTDGNNQAIPVYSDVADGSSTYTTFTATSTSWTGV